MLKKKPGDWGGIFLSLGFGYVSKGRRGLNCIPTSVSSLFQRLSAGTSRRYPQPFRGQHYPYPSFARVWPSLAFNFP